MPAVISRAITGLFSEKDCKIFGVVPASSSYVLDGFVCCCQFVFGVLEAMVNEEGIKGFPEKLPEADLEIMIIEQCYTAELFNAMPGFNVLQYKCCCALQLRSIRFGQSRLGLIPVTQGPG